MQTSQALRRKLDVKLFATIHHEVKNKTLRTKLKKANKGLLITMPVASFCFTEEVYKLASKVDFAARHGERKVILVTSVAEKDVYKRQTLRGTKHKKRSGHVSAPFCVLQGKDRNGQGDEKRDGDDHEQHPLYHRPGGIFRRAAVLLGKHHA